MHKIHTHVHVCASKYIHVHVQSQLITTQQKSTYHTEGAEHEAECYHGPRPPLSESIVAAVIVEDMTTLQLHEGIRRGERE